MRLFLDTAEVRISSPDQGSVSLHVRVVNFTSYTWHPNRVAIKGWTVGSRGLGKQSSFIHATGEVKPHSVGSVWFEVTLYAADVRALCEGVEPAHNLKSSPRCRLWIDATCVFKTGLRELEIPLRCERDHITTYIPTTFAELGA